MSDAIMLTPAQRIFQFGRFTLDPNMASLCRDGRQPALRQFFYMPFMHSEALADQERCVRLCHGLYDLDTLKWARHHADIVRRFGRFPHRNIILGRHATPAEKAFLEGGGFGG